MVANVWQRIIPAQQQMVAATRAGRPADFTLGERAKQRSVHNSYMTFPVLFIMLSNHFPATYAGPRNWLVLLLLFVAGAAVRHAMIGRGVSSRWALVPAGPPAAAMLLRPKSAAAPAHRTPLMRPRPRSGASGNHGAASPVLPYQSDRTFGPAPR
jgi:uncharacterized membrane protein